MKLILLATLIPVICGDKNKAKLPFNGGLFSLSDEVASLPQATFPGSSSQRQGD